MVPRKPKATAPATTSPVKPARVIKTRSSSAASAVKGPSVPITPSYHVKRYRNRMLNLEQTPEHLVDVAKRNATDSPLLRLPPETRNRIWSFAMGGQLIALPTLLRQNGFAVQVDKKTNAPDIDPYEFDLYPSFFNTKRLPASFHLPEVCRQIYSEASLTAYQQNVFLFGGPLRQSNNRFDRLMAVQRRAIKSVEIGGSRLYHTVISRLVSPMTDSLPNLERILVSAAAEDYACYGYAWQELRVNVNEGWQTFVLRRLREVYGDEIKIELEK